MNKRFSNFKLLRIVAMLMVVAHHFSAHGQFNYSTTGISINRLWIQLILMGGKIGVNIFVLISGYFLIQTTGINTSRILKLWLCLFFYSIVIYLIFVGSGSVDFSARGLVHAMLPVIYNMWWFASTYFIFYLFSPAINRFLTGLDRCSYQKMIFLLTICWCIIPTFTHRGLQSNELLWFIYLYALAAYYKLWGGMWASISGKRCLLMAVCTIGLTFLSVIIFDILGMKYSFFGDHATFFYSMQSLPILLISFLLFLGFENMKIGYHKFINVVSSATFGVCLIHDHAFVRIVLWENVFKNAAFADGIYLIPYSIFVIVLVFVVCTLLEFIENAKPPAMLGRIV